MESGELSGFYSEVDKAAEADTYIRDGYNPSITPIYNTWIIGKVNTFNTYIEAGMNDMFTWWDNLNGIAEVPVCESLGNRALGSLTMGDRLSSIMATMFRIITIPPRI